jgi:RNA recognition motif-containing protein
MTNKIYIGNLDYSITEENLKEIFGEYGTVEEAKVIVDRETGRSKGFAFVTMETEEEANKIIEELNGAELEGRNIKVSEARERKRNNNRRNNRW